MNKDLVHHELLKDLNRGRNSYYVCINKTTHWIGNTSTVDKKKIINKNSIVLYTGNFNEAMHPFGNIFSTNYKMSDFRVLTYEEYDYYIVKGNKKYVGGAKEEVKSSQSFPEGSIVYPTYESVNNYSFQFSNSVSGEVLKMSEYQDWIEVKWSNDKKNSYPKNCITTDFNKSVYVTNRSEYRPKSKFNGNLPDNIVKEIWLNVINKASGVDSFIKGNIAGCFSFAESKRGEDFWYEFSKYYNVSRFDECIKMFEKTNKPKDETIELSDDYWINYKLKESDLTGSLKDCPIIIAQHYYNLCIKFCETPKNQILNGIQNSPTFGFSWHMLPEGFDWSEVRNFNDFDSYYKHFGKSNTENDNSIDVDTKIESLKPVLHDGFWVVDEDEYNEILKSTTSKTTQEVKSNITQPVMKRFQKNKTARPVRKVSIEVNVKR